PKSRTALPPIFTPPKSRKCPLLINVPFPEWKLPVVRLSCKLQSPDPVIPKSMSEFPPVVMVLPVLEDVMSTATDQRSSSAGIVREPPMFKGAFPLELFNKVPFGMEVNVRLFIYTPNVGCT